jgi:hypothetical protein
VSTDRHGLYWIADLAPGRYDLRVTLPGFRTQSSAIVVSVGEWAAGSAALEVGPMQPHGLEVKWNLQGSESVVRVVTDLGALMMAVTARDFLACVDRTVYTAGTFELVGAPPSAPASPLLLRLRHNRAYPAAAGASHYALRIDDVAQLVAIHPATGAPGPVVGRIVEGLDVVQRIRERMGGPPNRTLSLEVLAVMRIFFL